MSKYKIRIIIGLMAVSSLALIAFQVYWIGYTARSNNEVFGANVKEAMQEVVRKLEKQELLYITQKKTAEDEKQKQLLAISTSKPVRNIEKAKPKRKQEQNSFAYESIDGLQRNAKSDMFNANPIQFFGREFPINEISIQLNLNDAANPTLEDIENINYFNDFVAQQMANYEKMLSGVDSSHIESQRKVKTTPKKIKRFKQKESIAKENISSDQFSKISQKTELMKDVFDDFLFKERPITERINRIALDSMLRNEIAERGYNLPFEYGISFNKDTAKLHYLSSPKLNLQKQQLIKSQGFKASLFPNDLYLSGNQLFVYFPNKQDYIFQSIWMNILGSIAMLGIVITCFYIAVNTILKQKKLADIKNDFINNMTHEFKTPISTISLACEVLSDKAIGANPSVVNRYLGIINEENKRLGTQVEKVLQTALMDKGEVKMKFGDLDVHDTINSVVENISPQIELKNGKIDLDLNAENINIEADSVHITNIIFNLLDNAIKYSSNAPEIKVESENAENGVIIRVIDNGIGLSSDVQKNIFEKFYRVPTGNLHDVKGFGLGLSYVKKMVEEHHGTIKVKSKLGEGSTFELYLPHKQRVFA
jgi:two-component system, OmpR family, phosphate regulon sensor histidine kinase PhoR